MTNLSYLKIPQLYNPMYFTTKLRHLATKAIQSYVNLRQNHESKLFESTAAKQSYVIYDKMAPPSYLSNTILRKCTTKSRI